MEVDAKSYQNQSSPVRTDRNANPMITLASFSTLIPPALPLPAASISNLPSTKKIPFHGFKSRQLFLRQSRRGLFASGSNGVGDARSAERKRAEKRDMRARLNVRWSELLDPDPENMAAVALTGVLAWASLQILWQLFLISLAILAAALKYSFIAALLIFILITLL